MKLVVLVISMTLCGCMTQTPEQRLQAQCEGVMAESLRTQMGCSKNTDARAQLFQQCQASCNGGVDRDAVDRCLVRCEEFLEKQKK